MSLPPETWEIWEEAPNPGHQGQVLGLVHPGVGGAVTGQGCAEGQPCGQGLFPWDRQGAHCPRRFWGPMEGLSPYCFSQVFQKLRSTQSAQPQAIFTKPHLHRTAICGRPVSHRAQYSDKQRLGNPILHMGKLRTGEGGSLVQGHTASKGGLESSSPGSRAWEALS